MKTRIVYPKPPIVEAVVEFGFSETVAQQALLESLGQDLAKKYAGPRKKQSRVDASITVNAEMVATEARRTTPIVFLISEDGLRLIGCAESALSVHVLAPYPGWERFAEQVEEAVAALPEVVKRKNLSRLSVRYVDRIVMPAGDIELGDYLKTVPKRPDSMPREISALHVVTQSRDPSDGTTALLTIAAIPPDSKEGRVELMYDLLLQRTGDPLCGLVDKKWLEIVDNLHVRQRDVFEDSITERMKQLFL